ncbi:SRPBCC family protein [Chloroflexi bacterium TSY]|nr:SRPBCC family protein [Chloroflexi bacterium TSY]
MNIEAQVTIQGPKEKIWQVITDIENAPKRISGIEEVEILEKPTDGLVGLKWRETRTLFVRTATETMWITDAVENEFYKTRAESHGAVYITDIALSEQDGRTSLTMKFDGTPQSFGAKLMSAAMGFMFKNATKKAVVQDLNDIKAAVENQEEE